MGGERCPWKKGCKYYGEDPLKARHYFGDYSYHCDENGRHHISVSSLKGVLDMGDPDMVGWINKMARTLFTSVKEKDQVGAAWPQPGDPKIARDPDGWCFWDHKVRAWIPRPELDFRFREAYYVCEQIKNCSADTGHWVHWYLWALLWRMVDYDPRFDPGNPPTLPLPFTAPFETAAGIDNLTVDYAATIPGRRRQVEEFVKAFSPYPLALEQKLLSAAGVAGSFDAMTMFPRGGLTNICSHVMGYEEGKYRLQLKIGRGLSTPFTQKEVVLVDWKTSKEHRFNTAVQLGLYFRIVQEAVQKTGSELVMPNRLMTVRFFEPQVLEMDDRFARPGWDVLEVPVEIGAELADAAYVKAQEMGVVF